MARFDNPEVSELSNLKSSPAKSVNHVSLSKNYVTLNLCNAHKFVDSQ